MLNPAFERNAIGNPRRGWSCVEFVEKVEGGRLRVRTPPDPRTGRVEKILDPLDLIQHCVRYRSWYSNQASRPSGPAGRDCWGASFEIDPLLCPACASLGTGRLTRLGGGDGIISRDLDLYVEEHIL